MTYVVESGGSPSRRSRRKRAAITLLVVALMLFFAFWYAYSYYRGDEKAQAPPAAVCTPKPTSTVAPKNVIVNVYNSTTRTGLAAKTATQVTKRGFVVDRVANDPLKRAVAGTAEIRYGPKGAEQAKLVQALVTGSKGRKDTRADTSVDLVIGAKFKTIAETPAVVDDGC